MSDYCDCMEMFVQVLDGGPLLLKCMFPSFAEVHMDGQFRELLMRNRKFACTWG